MAQITYRDTAEKDLDAIELHYTTISYTVWQSVLADIVSTINVLATFPYSGRPIADRPEKLINSTQYGYTISHIVSDDEVEIIGVFRYQNRNV